MNRPQRGTGYVAALVARLGGNVVITDEEAARAGDLTIKRDPVTAQTYISLKPVEIVGEIVTAEPQSIEPPKPQRYACAEIVWLDYHRTTCRYMIVNDQCVRHGKNGLRRLITEGPNA